MSLVLDYQLICYSHVYVFDERSEWFAQLSSRETIAYYLCFRDIHVPWHRGERNGLYQKVCKQAILIVLPTDQ
jgi:hypothetical protein